MKNITFYSYFFKTIKGVIGQTANTQCDTLNSQLAVKIDCAMTFFSFPSIFSCISQNLYHDCLALAGGCAVVSILRRWPNPGVLIGPCLSGARTGRRLHPAHLLLLPLLVILDNTVATEPQTVSVATMHP